ncbi:hypothetical protein GOODEAATRI_009886, partial [Goodea atripinnis]
ASDRMLGFRSILWSRLALPQWGRMEIRTENEKASLMSFFCVLPLLVPSVSHGAQGHYARKLLNDLMEDYSNALRPVEDTDKALNVSLQITLSQIKDMVSREDT